MNNYCLYYNCDCDDVTEEMQEQTGDTCYDDCDDCPSLEREDK